MDPEAVSVPMMAPALPDKRTAIPAVFEVRARQCHRGEILRGVRHATRPHLRELRGPTFPDDQILPRVRPSRERAAIPFCLPRDLHA